MPDIPFSVWRKIAMASWRPRTDPVILATVDVDAERLLAYIQAARAQTGEHVTPMHLIGRAMARIFTAMPGLNGRVVLGGFIPSPTVDGFFVVSLTTDAVAAGEATATDLSGTVIRKIDQKQPWEIAHELSERAALIRTDEDPQFKQTKAMVRSLPPLVMRVVLDVIGAVTESLQLPIPFMGLEARPYGSFLISNVGTYGLDRAFAPVPPFCKVPAGVLVGTVTDKPVVRDGRVVVRPMLPMGVMIDHRFVDGYQASIAAKLFTEYLEDPARFDPLPAGQPAEATAREPGKPRAGRPARAAAARRSAKPAA